MKINDCFCLPQKSGIAALAEAQVQLFRLNPKWQDYFLQLHLNFYRSGSIDFVSRSFAKRFFHSSILSGHEVARRLTRHKIKVDVLFCPMPYFQRASENRLMMRMFIGLAQTGATILCLLPDDAPCRKDMQTWLNAEGRAKQVTFMNLSSSLNPLTAKLVSLAGRARGSSELEAIVEVLDPLGLSPAPGSRSGFINAAAFIEAWRFLEPYVEFDAVVTRCHWQTLCSAVCRTALQRGKPVITFQQGVIGHTLDVPVTATKYIAFGNSSAALLVRMNRAFFQAVGTPAPVVEFIPSGSLFDTILSLPDQFSKHTLLIIDEPVGPDDFYGIGHQREAIFCCADKLLKSSAPPKIIIRPHPYWDSLGMDTWKELVLKYPNLCEISHSSWTLEEDLKRSSVVLGVFSGVLTVAAASGLPTFFLVTESGYVTEDLACFRSGQTFLPDEAFSKISRVLTDAQAFSEARSIALRNARDYYFNGSQLDLNATFFERVLGSVRVASSINGNKHP
jgi:hypothetical protein